MAATPTTARAATTIPAPGNRASRRFEQTSHRLFGRWLFWVVKSAVNTLATAFH
jgi:hypothetical protein